MTVDEARQEAMQLGATDQFLERLAERIGGRASVDTVFGPPVKRGDLSVIPVARVRWGVGGGAGSSETEGATGSGGGGGLVADPVGYLEVGPSGAAFRPIGRPWNNPGYLLAVAIGAALVIRAIARFRQPMA